MTKLAREGRALLRELTGLIWWASASITVAWVTVHELLQGDLAGLLELLAGMRLG